MGHCHQQLPFGDDFTFRKDVCFGDGLWHWIYHVRGGLQFPLIENDEPIIFWG